MLQDVSSRGTWSKGMLQDVSGRGTCKKCFKMSLAQALGVRNVQHVSGRGTCLRMSLAEALGARHALGCLYSPLVQDASGCVWQSQLEQEMLRDVSGRGAWSKTCFTCLWQRPLEQEMLQDVSGRGTWSKKCFLVSLAEALGARNASRCLW